MTCTYRRVVVVVLDGVGVGALPDAAAYGDEGTHTLAHTAAAVGGLKLPHLAALGLGRVDTIAGVPPAPSPPAAWGRLAEASAGKDTTTGHWELMGVILPDPFPTFPDGFPAEVLEAFCRETGVEGILGNRPASGTQIIQELGPEHQRTGYPIIYTSADSVFQIAAHVEVIPVPELYALCRAARRILEPLRVARVIARPFRGRPGAYERTAERKDFSLPPPEPTVLDAAAAAGLAVIGVGKIHDIFAGRGISRSFPTRSNAEGMARILAALEELERGLLFANLIDFDMLYGHRRDPQGFARALEEFDALLPDLLGRLGPGDLLLLTADHGNDPTHRRTTDHTREYTPILAYDPVRPRGAPVGTRSTFADVGATVAAALGLTPPRAGTSFLASW